MVFDLALMNCIFVDLVNKLINGLIDGFDYWFDGFIGFGFRFVELNGFSAFLVFVKFVGFVRCATFTPFVGLDGWWIDVFAA